MIRVYNILVSLFGESKQGGYDKSVTQYQFNSPWAKEYLGFADGKYNLEVSLSLGKWHEWTNNYGGNLSSLIREWGGKSTCDYYFGIISDIRDARYYDMTMFKDTNIMEEHKPLRLPVTFSKINLSTLKDKELLEYLDRRRITQDIIDEYNIGRTKWDGEEYKWRNRIIVPSYGVSGDLNYFVGRTYKKNDKRTKYLNCTADKKNIIFNESKITWEARVVLVEGIFDSLYLPNTIPLMGKFLHKDSTLYETITRRSCGELIICLDGDTLPEETDRILGDIYGRVTGKVKCIRLYDQSSYKDFGEIYEKEGKKGIINILKTAK